MFGIELSYRTLRLLKSIYAIPSAKRASRLILGDYRLPPFDRNPIHMEEQSNGWIRSFSGDLRLEYDTGLIYSGSLPIYGSTDELYTPKMPSTKPLAVRTQKRTILEEGIVLKSYFEDAYYHFLFELIPKLEIIERTGLSNDIPLIVTKGLASKRFFSDALELGLLGKRRIIIHEEDCVVQASRLYVVRADRYSGMQLSYLSRFADQDGQNNRRRIYVSRNGNAGAARQITNENDLIAQLKPLGFAVVDPGAMSLAEQIRCFANASIVVGPHGAGLTNILFRYGSPMALVEMINDTKIWNFHFFSIATQCGYFYRATQNRAEAGNEEKAPAHADIDATLEAVRESIAWEASVYDKRARLNSSAP